MNTKLSMVLLCGFFAIVAGWPGVLTAQPSADSPGEEPLVVDLASGRTLTAQLDPLTDPERLWLRWSRSGAVVQRPIQWDRVVRVRAGERSLPGAEFQRAVERFRELYPRPSQAAAGTMQISIKRPAAPKPTTDRSAPSRPVRSIAIDVRSANWDADVENDGLLVELRTLDERGRPTRVGGTLEVNLLAEMASAGRQTQPFRRIGRWAEPVRASDFRHGVATYRLPYKAVHPDCHWRCAPYGMVHARLSVPGQGVLESTQSTVRIRPYSPNRDRLEQLTGSRFHPLERTSRGYR